MGCDICGRWWAVWPKGHDCVQPEATVRCLLGWVWTLQPDGKWYASDPLPHVREALKEKGLTFP